MTEILSIGHSTLDYRHFVARLQSAGVTAVADVRTSPFSRNFPHFNREVLKAALASDKIAYVFLGKELGGRPKGEEFYTEGVADYEKMAQAGQFLKGLNRIEEGATKYHIALMCSERNPLDCHRCLLVGRALAERGLTVRHIVSDNQIVSQEEIETQLLALSGKESDDMFASLRDRLVEAYRDRSLKIAFSETRTDEGAPPGSSETIAAE